MTLLLLMLGCTRDVGLNVLQPADVTLPREIDTIAVFNRSRPKNVGQGVLDVIEGVLTGEAIGMDREGSRAAVFGAVDILRESPRYDVAVPLVDQDKYPSDIFDRPLNKRQVRELCRQNDVEALLALDAFDSDSVVTYDTHIEERTDKNGRELNVVVHDAMRETSIVSSWRLYDDKGNILDEVRDYRAARTFTGEGRTQSAALAAVTAPYETARVVGTTSGNAYARRISPSWIRLYRSYYTKGGDDRFKSAKNHVLADDWEGAEKVWTEISKSTDEKAKGRAMYNLAVAHEVYGELYKAHAKAKRAAVILGNGRSRDYVRMLNRRIADYERLQEQMKRAEKPAPRVHGQEQPLAVPTEQPAPPPKPGGMTRPAPKPTPKPPPKPSGMTRPR